MSRLIAIDPGTDTGIAVFHTGILQRAMPIKHDHATDLIRRLVCEEQTPVAIVCEKPKIYPVQRNEIDPNDMITLAIKVGQFVETAHMLGLSITLIEPATWKRQIFWKVCNARTWQKLTPQEQNDARNVTAYAESIRHNVLDAIGIGLHYVGRSILAH